jgi:hypothetical protein
MKRLLAGVIAMSYPLIAADRDLSSWQNLQRLSSGQAIHVKKTNNESERGTFVSFDDQSIRLRTDRQESVIPRPDVAQVRLRSHKGTWIGAGLGAAGGALVGATAAPSSDPDLRRPAAAGAAGAFALIGAWIGSVVSGRHNTIYKAK